MNILFVDNYDSFSYMIIDYLTTLGANVVCVKNDDLIGYRKNKFDAIVISPGPGAPSNSGISRQLISENYKKLPILGICLGMQVINEIFGGMTIRVPNPIHGKASKIFHNSDGLFEDVPNPFFAARYHSLMISGANDVLKITSKTEDDILMSFVHKEYPVYGVQFHPESFLTQYGDIILNNFLQVVRRRACV